MDIPSLQRFLENPDDARLLNELQKKFAAIWHARKCIKLNPTNYCNLPMCPEWRLVFNHYLTCTSGYDCTFQACSSSRVLIEHYDACTSTDCRFCGPLRKFSTTKKTETIVREEIRTTTCQPSTSEFAASMSKGYRSGRMGWNETACTARQAYFSTYSQEYFGEHRSSSFRFVSSSMYNRSPYGKTERIQRELIVMFHVQKCAELENHDPDKQHVCSVPHCPQMKRTLIHVAMCPPGKNCSFPECTVTRTIIQHWLKCDKLQCDVCAPVVKTIPALDGNAQYEMDDKLLALLYTSTNGLISIVSDDLSSYEGGWSEICYDGMETPKSTTAKRKVSAGQVSVSSPDSELDKRRRVD
ncbi:hypothetical protein M3Y97_00904200 [Aphelenchoides bicaudatus]|nr:hypothetical protein M3Y97_00904200 [Aphelenchoides bicaudatus]